MEREELFAKLPFSIVNDLIFKHIEVDAAQQELNLMGYSTFNFRHEVEKHYLSWHKAFEKIKIPFIINAFRRGKDPVEIYKMVGYSKSTATLHNNISRRLFFGADTQIVRLFLDRNPQISTLEDFEIIYKRGFLGKKD